MSNLQEIKQHTLKLWDIATRVPGNAVQLVIGAIAASLALSAKGFAVVQEAVPELIGRLKKSGRNFIVGGVVAGIGAAVLGVAALFLVWALILLLDKAIEELWLSALIVVGAMVLGGGFFALVGMATAWSSVKNIRKAVEDTAKGSADQTAGILEEAAAEVTELQVLSVREFKRGKRLLLDYLNIFYRLIPLGVMFLFLALLFVVRRFRKWKKKKEALRAPVEVVFKED